MLRCIDVCPVDTCCAFAKAIRQACLHRPAGILALRNHHPHAQLLSLGPRPCCRIGPHSRTAQSIPFGQTSAAAGIVVSTSPARLAQLGELSAFSPTDPFQASHIFCCHTVRTNRLQRAILFVREAVASSSRGLDHPHDSIELESTP